MEIKIEVTRAELDQMGVTEEALPGRVIEQLDNAVLPSGRTSAPWYGYWVTVTVKD